MIEYFNANPMLLISIIIFLLFVIIGFFGDKYIKKQQQIREMIEKENNSDENVTMEENEAETAIDNLISDAISTTDNVTELQNNNFSNEMASEPISSDIDSLSFNSMPEMANVNEKLQDEIPAENFPQSLNDMAPTGMPPIDLEDNPNNMF